MAPKRKAQAQPAPRSTKRRLKSPPVVQDAQQSQPKNPQASLLGLPAELRLHIYGHVFESTLIHVHFHGWEEEKKKGKGPKPPQGVGGRFTWTPCLATNRDSPLLCANPKWSGLCSEDHRCTFKPNQKPKESSSIALMWTCKFIHQEARESMLKLAAVSVSRIHWYRWIRYMEAIAPKQLAHLRRLTIAGPHEWSFKVILEEVRTRFPDLQGFGHQCQVDKYTMRDFQNKYTYDLTRWRDWNGNTGLPNFKPEIDVAVEAFMWIRPRTLPWALSQDDNHQIIIRLLRDGKKRELIEGVTGWEDNDVKIDLTRETPTQWKRNAPWRMWWRQKEDTLQFS